MNPDRMRARGLVFVHACAGKMLGFGLRFNKRAVGKHNVAYANIGYAPKECVEGVLYQLPSVDAIKEMDQFEGCPYRYSREVFPVISGEAVINAWVYVANPAMLAEALLPERRYLNHLLAGENWLSEKYHQWLASHCCSDGDITDVHASNSLGDLKGLKFNV